ncbi:hypothetical protein CMQ_7466 [Grosmannia clavigera kw1407]|uniref:Uncharacterized protein n=1 Tax=Grosmannia clavigera (strain kw1407 / UAMH 11150) TaxID=655863 RepID=F0XNK6_GROCL|nr:uncharacterized protein CMQ_7466 [Grosmannia clavigera kw1407]EFX00464.1 hypothetical protein CMQ_7466 [Grosmannia clavigera kw1407]
MDIILFSELLKKYETVEEKKTTCIDIFNYSDPTKNQYDQQKLSKDDFPNYVKRAGVFAPPALKGGLEFKNGIRLVVQDKAECPHTFGSGHVPLQKDHYELMVREMRLPFLWIETTAAVGPFFWWTYSQSLGIMQLIFRKSDVMRKDNVSRGWEMALSYSFDSKITSGFAKGTESAELAAVLGQMSACASPTAHPLLLPVLMLCNEISTSNDLRQRDLRHELREVETGISNRYPTKEQPGPEQKANQINLDTLHSRLTECHCNILWKNPKAWKGVATELRKAAKLFWNTIPVEQKDLGFAALHKELLNRLDFVSTKLDGLDCYKDVSIQRLDLQRDVMSSIISHRESRINLLIAIQQQQLANSSTRDSLSMKTLSFLGMFFLPSTFLSSLFSMPFFSFASDMHGSVSGRLWIYFVVGIPLTAVIVGLWYFFDRRSQAKFQHDFEMIETEMYKLEGRVAEDIFKKRKVRVLTLDSSSSTMEAKSPV